MVASSLAGQMYLWGLALESGQLIPLSHHVEWPKGVAVPVGLLLAVRLLLEERRRATWSLGMLTVLFFSAVFLVHSKELLHLGMLATAAAMALALTGRPLRSLVPRFIAILVLPLAFAFVMRHEIMQVHDIAAYDSAKMARFRADNADVWRSLPQSLWGPPVEQQTYAILRKLPPYALYLLIAPLCFLVRQRALVWAAFGAVGVILLIRVPALSYLYTILTYSEAVIAGETYLYPIPFLALASAVVGFGIAVAAGKRPWAAALVVGLALRILCEVGMKACERSVNALFAWVILGSAAALVLRWIRPQTVAVGCLETPDDRRLLSSTVLVVLPLLSLGPGRRAAPLVGPSHIESRIHEGVRPTLPELAISQALVCLPADPWTSRFDATFPPGAFSYPPDLLQALREIAGFRVVDGPFGGQRPPYLIEVHLFTRHYLVHTGTGYSSDLPFRRTYMPRGHHPLFTEPELLDVMAARDYLRREHVDLLILDPPHRFLAAKLGSLRELKSVESGWALYAVR